MLAGSLREVVERTEGTETDEQSTGRYWLKNGESWWTEQLLKDTYYSILGGDDGRKVNEGGEMQSLSR